MYWLKISKMMFWMATVMSIMSSSIATAYLSGLMGVTIIPAPYVGADLLAASAVSALIHIAGK